MMYWSRLTSLLIIFSSAEKKFQVIIADGQQNKPLIFCHNEEIKKNPFEFLKKSKGFNR